MQKLFLIITIVTLLPAWGCNNQERINDSDGKEATIGSGTGKHSLPVDVQSVTKSLISGKLYSEPDFSSPALTRFDTTQQIQVLDTDNNLFIKARIYKDTIAYTGYIPKAILPEDR
jgi:hypothetical protein